MNASLPNVTFPLNRNFAGNVAVNRANHPNDTLFFWAFESENGSLTADAGASDKPWAVWLNGGCDDMHVIANCIINKFYTNSPGASSLLGLLEENGPLLTQADGSLASNPYGWSGLVDYVWVDQPVYVLFHF